jgi:branched-chain amino acid transport system permease protein
MIPIEICLEYLGAISILVSSCLTLNIIQGYLGRFHFGHIAMALLASYSVAIALQADTFGAFCLRLAAGLLLMSILVVICCLLAILTPPDVFVLSSVAIVIFFYSIAEKATSITNGDLGIEIDLVPAGLPRIILLLILVLGLWLLTEALRRIEKSPLVLHLRAFRDNFTLYRSIGLRPSRPIVFAFALASFLTAPFSALGAIWLGQVQPQSYSLDQALLPVVALSFYGSDSWRAALYGPTIIMTFRFVLISAGLDTFVGPALYILLLGLIVFRSQRGLLQIASEREA